MTPREEAIADCKYAISLGETAYKQHYLSWRGATLPLGTPDADYAQAIMEINDKLNTEDCLLK